MTPTEVPDFEPLLGPYLARQYWAQSALGALAAGVMTGEPSLPVKVVDTEVLRSDHPGMASVVMECRKRTFHLVLGWRSAAIAPGVLGAQPGAVLGHSRDGSGDVLVYDAMADAELVAVLLNAVTRGAEPPRRGRVVRSLVSHSSLVYDDRLLMKCYRVIEPHPRPEIEMIRKLDAAGFNHMLAPVAHWHREGRDLALVREFIPGAVEGLALARTSLRDLLARARTAGTSGDGAQFKEVGLSGGDLGPEMLRLGETTAHMHLALAAAFGTLAGGAPGVGASGGGAPGVGAPGQPSSGTPAIRIHGDYHLRRVMRTDGGWLVAGFGDDPLLGAAAGTASQGEGRFASPLEDVADLCCSLHIAALEAVELQVRSTQAHALELARGWEAHNVAAFVKGYTETAGIERLVPLGADGLEQALAALVAERQN